MSKNSSPDRWLQSAAAAVAGVFVLGFVFSPLGAWTGAILSAWFIRTQKAWRGFLLLVAIVFIPSLVSNWHKFARAGMEYGAWMMLAALLSVLPYLLYRLTSERLQGFLSTLSLPLWGVVFQTLGRRWLPATIFDPHFLARTQNANTPLLPVATILGTSAIAFLVYWSAAVVIWMWKNQFRREKIAAGASIFGAACVATFGYGLFNLPSRPLLLQALPAGATLAWVCLVGGVGLSGWALIRPDKRRKVWANKSDVVALLRSPYSGNPLHVVSEQGQEALVSPSGEKFPIHRGIPVFLKPQDLTGSNQKYNRLYETIGGFYDDTQRVACALQGIDRHDHVMNYLRFLEVKPGDSVLETSVGTGRNFPYLPQGVKLFGLDLSAEMLANCQANLRRWEMDADLFCGNAESLPFADNSFDVVFHVGGINFFNDRARAIREMIRVAKPGSRFLIADETEKHVKSAYERFPITGRYFKNRKETVTAPVDLVPAEMQEIHLETLWEGRFYALTFRKPSS
jgi:ubiquinone/menaquinone biosynthesis C-methylase UbiE